MNGNGDGEPSLSAPLPAPLRTLKAKRNVTAVAVLIIAAAFTISTGEKECLFFGVFSLWFLWSGASLERDYKRGLIKEAELVCTGIRTRHTGNSLLITFRCNDNSTIQMRYSGGKSRLDDFIEGECYTIYYDSGSTANLLAYSHV